MFALLITSNVKLCAFCVESERYKDKGTESQRNNKTKLKRMRKWIGETQKDSELEVVVKMLPSSQSRTSFREL